MEEDITAKEAKTDDSDKETGDGDKDGRDADGDVVEDRDEEMEKLRQQLVDLAETQLKMIEDAAKKPTEVGSTGSSYRCNGCDRLRVGSEN